MEHIPTENTTNTSLPAENAAENTGTVTEATVVELIDKIMKSMGDTAKLYFANFDEISADADEEAYFDACNSKHQALSGSFMAHNTTLQGLIGLCNHLLDYLKPVSPQDWAAAVDAASAQLCASVERAEFCDDEARVKAFGNVGSEIKQMLIEMLKKQ